MLVETAVGGCAGNDDTRSDPATRDDDTFLAATLYERLHRPNPLDVLPYVNSTVVV